MIVRKLRLQNGWSQEQLAEMTGLSTRTVQRIEHGQKPSLESARALSAVFEVALTTFDSGESEMNDKAVIADDEQEAIAYVAKIKEFYTHGFFYLIFTPLILFKIGFDDPAVLWGLLGWSLGLVAHGLVAFEKLNIIGPSWEKRLVEKRLGRKL